MNKMIEEHRFSVCKREKLRGTKEEILSRLERLVKTDKWECIKDLFIHHFERDEIKYGAITNDIYCGEFIEGNALGFGTSVYLSPERVVGRKKFNGWEEHWRDLKTYDYWH